MEKKWLWTNIAIISVLLILLLVLVFYNSHRGASPNYWATFSQVAQDNSATYQQLKDAFKAACPSFKDCTPSNSLWYVVRAIGYYKVSPSDIMSKAEVKDLMNFYEKEYKDDKYQYSFIPMFLYFMNYMTPEEAYLWLDKLGSYKCSDFDCHMNQVKSVAHILTFLNISNVSNLKGKIKDYQTFYKNVCWKQQNRISTPSKELGFYLAYRQSCGLPLSESEKKEINEILNKASTPDEKKYKELIEKYFSDFLS